MASLLSAADCKKFLKAHPDAADTSPLIKALEEYGKAEGKDDVNALVAAIGQVVARAEAARKKNAKNKELANYLDDLIDDAGKEEAKASRRAAKESESDEDESDEDGELRAQLIRVKKLDAENARPFVLALGEVCGLVIGKRPPLTKDQKNRAREMRTGKGKLLIGRC